VPENHPQRCIYDKRYVGIHNSIDVDAAVTPPHRALGCKISRKMKASKKKMSPPPLPLLSSISPSQTAELLHYRRPPPPPP